MNRESSTLENRSIVELSNQERILFPGEGLTKGDLIGYYRRIAPFMLPHLEGRPVTMQRFPDGIEAGGFFQKDTPDYFPGWLKTATVPKEGGTVRHVLCDRPETLVYLANQACITLHVWLSRIDAIDRPDRLIFDLDPPAGDLGELRFAARTIRDILHDLDLACYLMTTGSRGLHVVTPLVREHDFDFVRHFAQDLAGLAAARFPGRLTVEQRKADRQGRIFLDYLRNGYAQTVVAPYSVRARPGAPVATPIRWDELDRIEPAQFNIRNLFGRLDRIGDPWAGIDRQSERLRKARERLNEELRQQ